MDADQILAIIKEFFAAIKTIFAQLKVIFGAIKGEEETTEANA